jgi:hypothetical protein
VRVLKVARRGIVVLLAFAFERLYPAQAAPDGAMLESDPHEETARAAARQLRAQGLSLRRVAAELERRGVRSRKGRGFAPVQVARMIG